MNVLPSSKVLAHKVTRSTFYRKIRNRSLQCIVVKTTRDTNFVNVRVGLIPLSRIWGIEKDLSHSLINVGPKC